jgi:hypothetical protein
MLAYVNSWPELAEPDELLFETVSLRYQLLHLLHHHQLEVYASATTRLPSAGGVTKGGFHCTISFPYSLAADTRF